jgi:mono/diheme cytochrome c family protein
MDASSGSTEVRRVRPGRPTVGLARVLRAAAGFVVTLVALLPAEVRAADEVEKQFRERIQPILDDYCIACHGNGMKKGGLALDESTLDQTRLHDRDLWWAVLKNVRAGIMPPAGKSRLSDTERRLLEDWIKYGAFGIEPTNSDPGRITVRRLNRVEYRNTIRDLMGVDYDTKVEFPPDDSGHGFDNIADVLTLSPLLLEKYLAAAKSIVSQVVPMVPRVLAETKIAGQRFHRVGARDKEEEGEGPLSLSYYEPASVRSTFRAEHQGRYQLLLDLTAYEKPGFASDYNRCRVVFKADGQELLRQEFSRQDNKPFHFQLDLDWTAGGHQLEFALEPLTPNERQLRSLAIRIDSVVVRGPLDRQFWIRPANHSRFFPSDAPEGGPERRLYARMLLRAFARKAFRRPVDEVTVNRLAALAEREYSAEGRTFEAGIAQAMAAVLASPMFLFREERLEENSSDQYPLIDEYALASRLSYFLWSSMPDAELFRLAEEHTLRKNLSTQLKRMLADPRSGEFVRNFVGQWLQARDIETVPINAFAVMYRDQPSDPDANRYRARLQELNRRFPDSLADNEKKELNEVRAAYFKSFRNFREHDLNEELRQAMRRETEMFVDRIVRQDRSLRELLVSDYTFLNERLAKHYGIVGVEGNEMRLVALPPKSPRGGVLTQGIVLAVTSNPDRTSPVKRGLFILDNILGIPPPPPPPNIPALEEAAKEFAGRTPTLRETLELHRKRPACSSCHNRMDPLGLALENFNALGRWREREQGNPVDSTGRLITGESFSNVQELKRILADQHSRDFFRCLSEKMLTYALGRGLNYHDVETVDTLVDRIERENGRAGALIAGVVESAQFQRRQRPTLVKPPTRTDMTTAYPGPRGEPRIQP